MSTAVKIEPKHVDQIAFQEASLDIWDKKYRLTAKDGSAVDRTMDDTWKRVAVALAEVESPAVREEWRERFLWALRKGAIPAGRIMSNAGALEHKPATSTINCTVSGTILDSMDDILCKVHEAGLTLKAGCGIGYEFSTLRPRGAYVSGAGAYTSGPLSFMDIYDKMCFTVSSAGGRRGAQMGTFDVGHPDAMDFVRAKRENGRLRQFNLSLLVTDEFMQAVRADGEWKLAFPLSKRSTTPPSTTWPTARRSSGASGRTPGLRHQRRGPGGLQGLQGPAGAAHVGPHHVVDLRLRGARLRADRPGQRDEQQLVVREHPRHQPLRRAAAAALRLLPAGLVNLTRFVRNPFTPEAEFDWDEYREVVRVFTRMLDNVVEINGLPLGQQRDEIHRKRRHGMGFLGLGSTITMLGMKYGSPESVAFTENVSRARWRSPAGRPRSSSPARRARRRS
jgi:ribonucleoside-diphosphate reductase alpha chain